MPYQTLQGLQLIYGASRLAEHTPGGPVASGDSYWTPILEAAAALIDANLKQGGYRTPVDLSTISDETERARVEGLLKHWNGVLALEMGCPAMIAVPKGVDSAADQVRRILQQVLRGAIRLPMAMVANVFASTYGPDADGINEVAPSMPDRLFHRQRSNGYSWDD